jgi:uncharacterized membrane protein YgcG
MLLLGLALLVSLLGLLGLLVWIAITLVQIHRALTVLGRLLVDQTHTIDTHGDELRHDLHDLLDRTPADRG